MKCLEPKQERKRGQIGTAEREGERESHATNMARICRRAAVVAVAICTCPASSFTPSTFVGGVQNAVLCGKPSSSSQLASSHARDDASTTTMAMKKTGGNKRARVRKVWRRGHLQAREVKDKLNAGVWDKFRAPRDGGGHDEVTFRSGFEGRTLTIPQGGCRAVGVLSGVVLSLSCFFLSSDDDGCRYKN